MFLKDHPPSHIYVVFINVGVYTFKNLRAYLSVKDVNCDIF